MRARAWDYRDYEGYERGRGTGRRVNVGLGSVGSFALGALSMYLLDPDGGNRRRALIRDKLYRAMNETGEAMAKTAEYTRDRSKGVVAETTRMFRSDDAGDDVVRDRVRSAMGRVVSHPSAIAVDARDGTVTLLGPILANEVDRLISTVQGVRGVKGVENRLEVHEDASGVPALQGGRQRPGPRQGIMQENWSPLTRLWTGLAGGGLALWGFTRGGLIGPVAGLLGAGVLLRSVTNLEARRLTGVGAGPRAVEVQKTINIAAPIDQVFGFFSNYENFPWFMRNVREVRDLGEGRSHWVVAGPAGVNVEWDAVLTYYGPNEVIAWRSVAGATVENEGVLRFQGNEDGSTRVDIHLSYNPPGGALGHAVAKLFGADPKSEMDEDLARVKTTIETGNPPRDAAKVVEESGRRG